MIGSTADGGPARHPIPTDTKIWIIADDVAGNDGDAIATWPDHNGGPSYVQATGGSQPLLKKAANGINGHNALSFDGVDDIMTSTTVATSGSTDLTVIYVIKSQTNAHDEVVIWAATPLILSAGNSASGTNTLSMGRSYLGQPLGANNYVSQNLTESVLYVKDGTGWNITTNTGAATSPNPQGDVSVATLTTPQIGFFNTLEHYNGLLAEVIVWNRTLSAAEQANVRANLALKYAIT